MLAFGEGRQASLRSGQYNFLRGEVHVGEFTVSRRFELAVRPDRTLEYVIAAQFDETYILLAGCKML